MDLKSMRLLGLGFWQAWWMLTMCSPVIFPANLSGRFPFDPILMVLFLTTLGYLVIVLASRSKSPFVKSRLSFIIAAGISFVGTLAMAIIARSELSDIVVAYTIATLLFSTGNALLLIMWGELWSTLATGRVGRYLYVSYAFAFVLFFIIRALPMELTIIFTSLLPVVSAVILSDARREPRREPASITFDLEPFSKTKVFLALILISICWGFSQAVFGIMDSGSDALAQSFFLAGIGIAALALNLFITQPDIEALSLFRPIIPAMSVGLILMAMLPDSMAFLGSGFTVIAIYSLDMLIMLVSTDIAFRTRLPVALTFGLSILAARTGTLVGSFLFISIHQSPFWFADLGRDILLACAIVVILAGTLLFNQVDLQRFYKARSTYVRGSQSIAEKCDNIGQACGLTTRELEVLQLLASGRSVPYICDELTIAQGTAKHHVSNIYRKVGVYDRQSLHDIIEQGSVGKGAL